MNPLNYASLEASKRLVDAGIVLEAEAKWVEEELVPFSNKAIFKWYLYPKNQVRDGGIPAPSTAEIWRELPESYRVNGWLAFPKLTRVGKLSFASYCSPDGESKVFGGENPADALISLLIFVREKT